jgi:hypothetical protein
MPPRSLTFLFGVLVAAALSGAGPAFSQSLEGDTPRIERPVTPQAEPARPSGVKPGFSGLGLRQNPEGAVVVRVQPGPFSGDGFKSPSIWRGDLIVSMNGQSLDAAGYAELLKSLAAGDALRVVYRRGSSADPYSAVPHGDPNGEERTIEIVLDDSEKWSGTIGQGLAPGHVIPPAPAGEFEDLVLARAEELGLRGAPGGVDALLASLSEAQQKLLAPNSLPAVVQALQRPLSLDRVEAGIASQVRPLAERQSLQQSLLAIQSFILQTLGLEDLQAQPDIAVRLAAAKRDYGQRAVSLVKWTLHDSGALGPELPQYLELMRAGPEIAALSVAMLPKVAQYAAELEKFAQEVSAFPQPIPPELAERVSAAVEGPVLGAKLVDGELWIVGGEQSNRYNMDLIAAVFDVGGADVYTFSAPRQGLYQIIIDQSGDDLYESNADFAGPATAFLSVSVLWDRGGNDRYVSHYQGSAAAGLFGVAILIDEAGDDQYLNDTAGAGWSQGVGFYGAGLLIDRGGDDLYQAQILSQGVGGPSGIGLIVDASGNDIYTANGPHFPSVYETPGVFAGMSQGFGFGIRGYAPGGIGALYDFAGDDRYSVGEFGQGCGYFQGLGILHDAAGNDQYVGSRYAQGSAAHQAAGILVDDAGDDSYSCPGPAAQGASWDQSVAMLVDRAGDDVYTANVLAQGSGAQQAIGLLVDLDGQDRYECTSACLGQSGDNSYRYDADKVFSFSAFFHRGGRTDTYPQSRSNDQLIRTGTFVPDNPASSDCYGLFLDD